MTSWTCSLNGSCALSAKHTVDGRRVLVDAMGAEDVEVDIGERVIAWTPIPDVIAKELRLRLEGFHGTAVSATGELPSRQTILAIRCLQQNAHSP